MIDWALAVAGQEGLGLTVACEPTGHRWKPVLDRCAAAASTLVCVPPLLVHRSREHEDLTRDRSAPKDATLIARLARDLRCYLPLAPEADWARLRHLGIRCHAKLTEATRACQQFRDLLEADWPAALEAAGKELDSQPLLACLMVTTDPPNLPGCTSRPSPARWPGPWGAWGVSDGATASCGPCTTPRWSLPKASPTG